MRKFMLLIPVLVLAGCASSDRPNPASGIIKGIDRNGSNEASWEEFSQYYADLFTRLDTNKDGKISEEEFKAFGEAPLKSQRLPHMDMNLSMFDSDKDGYLSNDEFQRIGDRLFSILDKNNDGLVTEDDFKMPGRGFMGGGDEMRKPPGGGMGRGGMGGGMPRF